METRRRISDSKLENDGGGAREGARSTSFASGGESDDASSRSGRVRSDPDRKLKVRRFLCVCVWCSRVLVGRGVGGGGLLCCCCCVCMDGCGNCVVAVVVVTVVTVVNG